MDLIKESRKSNKNLTSEIAEARVLAAYGDPGILEDYDFDTLSTFLICYIESIDRIPMRSDQGIGNKIVVVARPKSLWITAGQNTGNVTTQTRIDAAGNVSVGSAIDGFSIAGIPPINEPYQLGEKIKIRKLSQPYTFPNPLPFFSSSVPGIPNGVFNYGPWYNQGISSSYIQNTPNAIYYATEKPIDQVAGNTYAFYINKFHYENFIINYNSIYNPQNVAGLISIFAGNGLPNGNQAIYSIKGGYLFGNGNIYSSNYYSINYEDINEGNKQRISESSCNPLIVTTPDSFPSPSTRQVGNISYNPSYQNIVIQ